MITIRNYQTSDAKALHALFYHTVRHISIRDYSKAQVRAWAPDNHDEAAWEARMAAINPFVAETDGKVVGYADVQENGYIDHFFCHWQHQGKGIGKTLMQTLFDTAKSKGLERLYAHVSITAKPFFAHFGFIPVKQQEVAIRGETLTNFVMEKSLESEPR